MIAPRLRATSVIEMNKRATIGSFGIVLIGGLMMSCNALGAENKNPPEKPVDLEVVIRSSKDGTDQKALFYRPEQADIKTAKQPVPLIVTLHTWSSGYAQAKSYVPQAKAWGWVMIAPDFRGSNKRPEACASELAIQDVLDAVAYARQHARIDERRIYLVGASGGGHMALMMAAKAPDIWAGVSAWVPISDIAAWHSFKTSGYGRMIEQCCGGPPGTPATDAQYKARSPIHFLAKAKGLPLDINAGIHDGHTYEGRTGSVPISHSLNAFNIVAKANGEDAKVLSEAQIAEMTETQKVPTALAGESVKDPERGSKLVLFRRVAGPARITIFEGGHEEHVPAAFAWLSAQIKGTPADFSIPTQPRNPGGQSGNTVEVPK